MTAAAGFEQGVGKLALEMWNDNVVHDALIDEKDGSVLMGLAMKNWRAYGNPIVEGITHGGDGGTSSTLADAQATYNSDGEEKWQLTLNDEHAVVQITNKLRLSMQGSKAAMVRGLEHITTKQFNRFRRNIALDLMRDHGGARGQIASGSASTTLTLVNPDDAIHFRKGDVIASDDTDGTGVAPADDGEYITISGVDPDAGTISKTGANWNASGNFVANDYLFLRGTIGAKPYGLPEWVPSSAPSSTAYFGIDRTQEPVMLGGLRFSSDAALDGTHANALRRCAAKLHRFGGTPDCVLVNYLDWHQIASEMGSPQVYLVNPTNAKNTIVSHIGYSAIALVTGKGKIDIIPSIDVPLNRAYMLTRKTIKVIGNREPGIDRFDGNRVLRMSSVAGHELRFEAYFQLVVTIPGHNATLNLTPTYTG